MLRKETQFWESLQFLLDCSMLAGCWLMAYELRFSGLFVPVFHGIPDMGEYVRVLLFVPVVWGVIFRSLQWFRPRRRGTHLGEAVLLFKGSTLVTLGMMSAAYLAFKLNLSRVFLAWFWLGSTLGLLGSRVLFREALRFARRRGLHQRAVLIVGTDELATYIRERLTLHPELGMKVVGFVAVDETQAPKEVAGLPVVGDLNRIVDVIREYDVEHLFLSLGPEVHQRLELILAEVDDSLVDINLVSDLYRHALLRGSVEDFEGLPVIGVDSSPMAGWSGVFKRGFDLTVSGILLLVFSPVLLFIATVLYLTQGRPILYRQERMGLDGGTFVITKFRTMNTSAEKRGAVWSQEGRPDTTRFGRFLRRTSLDELPQLVNVFLGEMSLVGPRPERPVFVEEFQKNIPRYMSRHKVKAGLTGWAQINGLRGNTSIQSRLQYDLFYIRNWSMWLDVKILWRTLCGGFMNRGA
ncbi:MAG: Undecaprenyl-phosphate glucose phosphotransferase [Planctomycetota bacterium]|jgi:Undecaprenyl-phosphate glucose phosphotransferase